MFGPVHTVCPRMRKSVKICAYQVSSRSHGKATSTPSAEYLRASHSHKPSARWCRVETGRRAQVVARRCSLGRPRSAWSGANQLSKKSTRNCRLPTHKQHLACQYLLLLGKQRHKHQTPSTHTDAQTGPSRRFLADSASATRTLI